MNNVFRKLASTLLAAVCSLLVLGLLSSCSKQESQTPASPSGGVGQNVIKSAEKTTFAEVTAHLDPGGNVYGYMDTTAWLDGLSGKMDGWRELLLSIPNASSSDQEQIGKVFDFAKQFVKMSGMESVGGVGFSGIALEPGYYQSKLFVHRNSAASEGLLWSATGKAGRPLNELDWLPSETAWAMFGDLDVSQIWSAVEKELQKANVPEVAQGLKMMDDAVRKSTGSDLSKLLASLGGEYGIVLTLDTARKVAVPTFSETKLDIPEPGLLIAIKVKDDLLFDLIDKNSKTQSGVISTEKDGLKMRTMPVPLPLPIALRPTVARFEDFLFIASSDALVENIAATKSGKRPGLKSLPDFQHLAKGMPTQGNQLVFVSESLGNTIRDVQAAVLNSPLAKNGDQKAAAAFMEKAMQFGSANSAYSVGGHTPDGWLTVMHGNKSPVTIMAAPMVIAPLGVLAGIAVPAFAKAKQRAESISCVNNMKQVALSAIMWADQNKGAFPPDLASLKDELGSPSVLVCPDDKSVPNRNELTWENFDFSMCSYEFLLPNAKAEDAAQQALLRCKVHGYTALGDGSVSQQNTPGRKRTTK